VNTYCTPGKTPKTIAAQLRISALHFSYRNGCFWLAQPEAAAKALPSVDCSELAQYWFAV
jgi:hypothetical protein